MYKCKVASSRAKVKDRDCIRGKNNWSSSSLILQCLPIVKKELVIKLCMTRNVKSLFRVISNIMCLLKLSINQKSINPILNSTVILKGTSYLG
jgi:hypothetical protein